MSRWKDVNLAFLTLKFKKQPRFEKG